MTNAFTAAFDDMLGIERVPADIYHKFYDSIDQLGFDPVLIALRELNGYSLHASTGYAADDVQGLIEYTLANHNYITEGIPRLKQLKEDARLKASAVPDFRRYTEHLMLNALQGTQQAMQNEAVYNVKHDVTWELLGSVEQQKRLDTAKRPIHNIIYSNLSQPHRKVQELTWAKVHGKFFGFIERFRAYMDTCETRWSLRPISALSIGNRESFLVAHTLPLPELWMRPAELEMSRAIFNANLEHSLFRFMSIEEATNEISMAQANQREFLWWDSKAAYAIAQSNYGDRIAIAPSALSPWLLDDVTTDVPIILSEPRYGGAYKIHGYHYQTLHPNVILDNTWPMFTGHIQHDHYAFIADSLHLICVGMSLWASQIKLGRGHQRMSWTDSPINASVCVWFAEALERLNTKLVESNV